MERDSDRRHRQQLEFSKERVDKRGSSFVKKDLDLAKRESTFWLQHVGDRQEISEQLSHIAFLKMELAQEV